MRLIRGLKHKPLGGKLITAVLDTTYVNKNWGVWSFTKKELLEDQSFHQDLDNLASIIGIGASGTAGKDFVVKLYKERKMTRGALVAIVIWGSVYFNKLELAKVNQEIQRRTVIRSIQAP